MAAKKISVTRETDTGRNSGFKHGNRELTRPELVREIKRGDHPDYHIRKINGVDTPVSNPDGKKGNNLG